MKKKPSGSNFSIYGLGLASKDFLNGFDFIVSYLFYGRPLSSSVFIGFSQGFKSFSIKKLV